MAKKPAENPFSEALSRLVSIPRAEMQKRLKDAPPEKVAKHKRYKYVPGPLGSPAKGGVIQIPESSPKA